MARKIERFGKVINTPEALTIYNERQICCNEIQHLENQVTEHYRIYWEMEGKYSLRTISDPYASQGSRRYSYQYPSQEIKAQENTEREVYYRQYIKPLKKQIDELRLKISALDENLCIALWGFGREYYDIKCNLAKAEAELAEQIEYVEQLKKQLKNFEKPLDRTIKV